jgi:RimJ/RimL family protein N-acetyltransferase
VTVRFAAPTGPLTDGVVTLRLPSVDAGDVDAVISYSKEEEQLDESWLPLIPHASAAQSVGDWLDGWAGRPCHNGPTFVVTILDEQRFVGIVGFSDRGEGNVEMIYGIAPRSRGRGLATRASRLGASWALDLAGVNTVELRIAQDEPVSQHVALNADFVQVGTVSQFVAGTGETFEDLRYVLSRGQVIAAG